jgi:hypothetical protein
MNTLTVGLFFSPWDPHLKSPSAVRSRNPLTMYRRAVWFKANPRDEKYMKELFTEYFREGVFINIDRDPFWHNSVREADMVVLLYPDAIGQGFYRLEKKVQRRKRRCAAIRALNGRRREFLLNRATLCSLRVRRIMERWMLGEVAALILFAFITPVLLIIDLLKGRQ